MLWQKESKSQPSMYVDIFALNGGQRVLDEICRPYRSISGSAINKDDAIALQKRKEGNEFFGRHSYVDAMQCYNDCLRFVPPESKQICLAYANRSACFFHMTLYNECLVDIELAKEFELAKDLMSKLDRRQADCLARIEDGEQKSQDMFTKLSLKADERFPCMANVLKIHKDDATGGKLAMFAKENIEAGRTIVVEKAFATQEIQSYGSKCNICLKENANLKPCQKCTIGMFCGDECLNGYLHAFECGFKYSDESCRNIRMLGNLRLSLIAINMFTSAVELMHFVVDAIESDPNELPSTLSDARSQYRDFLKLPVNESLIVQRNEACQHYEVYRMLFDFPKIESMFKLEKHRRFLMHLIGQHYLISRHNSTQQNMVSPVEGRVEVSSLISVITRYFHHSCAPNCLMGTYHGNTFFITLRPIRKDSQLFISKLMIITEDTKQRRQLLWKQRNIICKCTRCEDLCTASGAQRLKVVADPDYDAIASTDILTASTDELQAMIAKCAAFSEKYGSIPWCDEIAIFVHLYIRLLNVYKRGYRTGFIANQI